MKRLPRNKLPGSMSAVINHEAMVKARHDHQLALAKKKGGATRDKFKKTDQVLVQCNKTKG